jgi:ATP-dependent Clp protease protease subunit
VILCKTDTSELFLDGVVGSDWTGEGITASGVSSALSKIKGRAVVRINSPGGSADEGVAIYNLLKRHPGGVDTHNEALAASAASVIFLAGEKRTMERGSKLMIHCAHSIAIGNTADMRKMSDVLAMYDSHMEEIYAEYMSLEKTVVASLMADETWFDATESVEIGLATHMSPTVRTKSAAAAAWFRHPPQDLFEENSVRQATDWLKLAQCRLQLAKAK